MILSPTDVASESLVFNSELLVSDTYSPRVLPFTETLESLEPKTLIDFESSDLLKADVKIFAPNFKDLAALEFFVFVNKVFISDLILSLASLGAESY